MFGITCATRWALLSTQRPLATRTCYPSRFARPRG
jgi:hypothetical protein